jgi:hypothetical protein
MIATPEEISMGNIAAEPPSADCVLAVLKGGPASLPQESRTQTVGQLAEKIKIMHYGGYEHFERIGTPQESGRRGEIIFHWTMRTEIAE